MTYTEKLQKAIAKSNSCLCVGLDPDLDRIPAPLKSEYPIPSQTVLAFMKQVIDATKATCAAYKPNLGFFEALGEDGFRIFKEIIDYIPSDKIVIADAKRGDISSTADHYARAYFKTFDVDALTINPLMGFESLNPFLSYPGKAIYCLTLTSNPGADDFLMQPFRKHPSMAAFIAHKLSGLQQGSAAHLGMVVGATKAKEFTEVIRHHTTGSLLIPGVGTQGGSIPGLLNALGRHKGIPLINSSRSILYAGKNDADWQEAVLQKARQFKEKLKDITENYV